MKYLVLILLASCAFKRDYPKPVIYSDEEACRKDTQEMIDKVKVISGKIDEFLAKQTDLQGHRYNNSIAADAAMVLYKIYGDSIEKYKGKGWDLVRGDTIKFYQLLGHYAEVKAGRSKKYR